MKITSIKLNDICVFDNPIVACIGYFDGLHLGHKALIDKTIEYARDNKCESALITFSPDPWITIRGISDVKHLSTMQQRKCLLEKMGIEHLIIIEFTKEVAILSHDDFVKKILIPCNLKVLVCGFDFHYGYKGAGDANTLKVDSEGHFQTYIVESIDEEHCKISSTRITNYIEDGNIEHANRLLGYLYTIQGLVIHGKSKGKEIGFPTANILVDSKLIIPKRGVYAGYILVDNQEYKAIINVGHNPTFNYNDAISVEVNIIQFNREIYGENVEVRFSNRLRDEKKFDSIEQLIKQLNLDYTQTLNLLEHN